MCVCAIFSQNRSNNSFHLCPFCSRGRTLQYYTQGQPESDKVEIDREIGIGATKAKQLADDANAGATDAQAKVSGIVDQTKAGWAQTRERALQYTVSDASNAVLC